MLRVSFVIALLLVVKCYSDKQEMVISEDIVQKVNILNVGWEATIYPQFANLTLEKASLMLGSKGGWPRENPPQERRVEIVENIPDTFDSRQRWPGSIRPIRNQGQCGSCWAFGASETLSDRFAIASQNRIDVVLSAQQLVDCDTDNSGCNGGWPIKAWNYMVKTGLLTKGCYGPYYAEQYQCRLNGSSITECPSGSTAEVPRFYHAKNAYGIPARNVPAMQTEIMTYGPVEADFTVYQDFFAYKSGVYTHTTGTQAGGHAIKVIGWGTENGVPYWLCANSWGTTWGLQGYFKIRRGADECGIEDGVTAGQALL
ncbi:cathepsin B-like [Actinia tenebrosa]|uniref:Cathepsin B-like n=1 Tax=Actinia tenebrosa TaxID=6105 RepID=A0A6P8IZW4_ACTTE|nr:cathepsin B-like [Actinia tenebrosa]